MEYVYGTLTTEHTGNLYINIGSLDPAGTHTSFRGYVKKNNSTKKYYYIIDSEWAIYEGINGVYYTEDSSSIYIDETIHYSWNFGKRYYHYDPARTSPATIYSGLFGYFCARLNSASDTTKELYAKTIQSNSFTEYEFSQMCDGCTELRKVKFNNYFPIATTEERYILYYTFRNCSSLRFCDIGNLIKSSYVMLRGIWGSFAYCTDITINIRDCDFSGYEEFNITASRNFVPNNNTIRLVYDTVEKLGVMQDYYTNVVYTKWAIMCETENAGDIVYMAPYNSDDWVGGDSGAYNNNDVILSIHEGLANSAPMMTDSNYRSMFEDNTTLVKVDLSLIKTSHVTNMRAMFRGCTSLQELNIGGLFDTSHVTDFTDFLGSGVNAVPNTCKIYYNTSTINQTLKAMYSNYKWIAVDEHYRIF